MPFRNLTLNFDDLLSIADRYSCVTEHVMYVYLLSDSVSCIRPEIHMQCVALKPSNNRVNVV